MAAEAPPMRAPRDLGPIRTEHRGGQVTATAKILGVHYELVASRERRTLVEFILRKEVPADVSLVRAAFDNDASQHSDPDRSTSAARRVIRIITTSSRSMAGAIRDKQVALEADIPVGRES